MYDVLVGVHAGCGLLGLAAPLAVKPPAEGVDPAAPAAAVREFAVFLGFFVWLILGAVWAGLRVLAVRRGAVPTGHPLDVGIARLTLAGGVALGLAGIWMLNPLYVLFGITGVLTGSS